MSDKPDKTTIEVTRAVWAALDKRKDEGESFNDLIIRLINQTPVKFGDLEVGDIPDIDLRDPKPLKNGGDINKETCDGFDPVEGPCDETPKYRQEYRFTEDGDWGVWYWCEEHAPEEVQDE